MSSFTQMAEEFARQGRDADAAYCQARADGMNAAEASRIAYGEE